MDEFLEVVCLGVLEYSVPLTDLSDADDLCQTLLRATETSRLLCIVHGVSTTPYSVLLLNDPFIRTRIWSISGSIDLLLRIIIED